MNRKLMAIVIGICGVALLIAAAISAFQTTAYTEARVVSAVALVLGLVMCVVPFVIWPIERRKR